MASAVTVFDAESCVFHCRIHVLTMHIPTPPIFVLQATTCSWTLGRRSV